MMDTGIGVHAVTRTWVFAAKLSNYLLPRRYLSLATLPQNIFHHKIDPSARPSSRSGGSLGKGIHRIGQIDMAARRGREKFCGKFDCAGMTKSAGNDKQIRVILDRLWRSCQSSLDTE